MIFSSLVFVCVFLPITYLLYTVVPSLKVKNAVLIAASLLFYAYGEPVYVLLMLLSAVLNYGFALVIDRKKSIRKWMLIIAVVVNIGILGIFKYLPFLVVTWNHVTGIQIPVPEISLPIGISFFTFQALSYVIDVYFEKTKAQSNFFHILLYISFFPQLIAGPIVKYRDISEEILNRKQSLRESAEGMRRFICGLGKKVLIANTMGLVADNIYAADISNVNVAAAWIGAIAYMLQIYYDFSGYSDMAIGMGRMFGFHFKENFCYPYGAAGIQDFWRRWHISLTTWFREYLYFPLGGNRKGKKRTYLNRMIVFLLTGLWHGANWTFVLWGLYNGVLFFIESAIPAVKKLPKIISRLYTLIFVCVGFVIFRADSIMQAGKMIGKMFTGFDFSPQAVSLAARQLTPLFLFFLIVGILGAAPVRVVADKIRAGLGRKEADLSTKWNVIQYGLFTMSVFLLAWCIIRLSGSAYNPFIYFRF